MPNLFRLTSAFCIAALLPFAAQSQSGIARGTQTPGATLGNNTAGANAPLPRPNTPGEVCEMVGTTSLCASSVLPTSSAADYGPKNVMDGRADTGWVEGVPGVGNGESLTFGFAKATTIATLRLLNGYGKSPRLWQRNGRARTITLTTSNGKGLRVNLLDQPDWQTVSLTGFQGVTWIKITMDDAKPGSTYEDTVISEIELR